LFFCETPQDLAKKKKKKMLVKKNQVSVYKTSDQ
jgi:hypothetical protein